VRLLSFLFILFLSNAVIAQSSENIEFKKKNFKERKSAFKDAKKDYKQGNKYFMLGPGYYSLAVKHYIPAYIFNKNNAELNYKLGTCFLKSVEKDKAIKYFERAVKLDSTVASDLLFKLGESYQVTYEWDKAISAYHDYKKKLKYDELVKEGKLVDKRIGECETGIKLCNEVDTARVFIDNVEGVNSKYPEYAAFINADESMMVFTSKRPTSSRGKVDKMNEYDEDIFISYRKGIVWSEPENPGSPLNDKHQNAAIGLSADGSQILVFDSNGGSLGDIYVSDKKGKRWKKPKEISKNINSNFHETSAGVTYDNKMLVFSSNNPKIAGHKGGQDIYFSKKDKKGRWGKPQSLSANINTEYDEVDVFLHPDGRTMYFASNGHNTMGGFDIFRTELQNDGTWGDPINIGHPINTPGDDRFFVMAGSGKHGYYSSIKEDSKGRHDIYMITFLGPEKQIFLSNEDNLIATIAKPIKEEPVIEEAVEIKTSRLTILKGKVRDGFSEEFVPIEATIEIIDNETGEIISTIMSNAATGEFLVPLPSGKDYAIAVKKEGYLFHSENFNIPPTSKYQEVYLDIKLLKMEKDSKIVLKNVFFDLGKSTLDPKSYNELDRLIGILNDHEKMRIEISGHTDNTSSYDFNKKLSEARAKAVVDYLSKDIDRSRMEYVGHAYDYPIAENDTPEGRAQNRRVEFKILSNEEKKK